MFVFQMVWVHNGSEVSGFEELLAGVEFWVVEPGNVLTDVLVYVLLSSQVSPTVA